MVVPVDPFEGGEFDRFDSWAGGGRAVIRDYGNGDDLIRIDLAKSNDGSGLSFRGRTRPARSSRAASRDPRSGAEAAGPTLEDLDLVQEASAGVHGRRPGRHAA